MLLKVIYVWSQNGVYLYFDYQSNSQVFSTHDHYVLDMLDESIHSN
jgi:hypothetical protein